MFKCFNITEKEYTVTIETGAVSDKAGNLLSVEKTFTVTANSDVSTDEITPKPAVNFRGIPEAEAEI